MRCLHCGNEISEDSQFCFHCGEEVILGKSKQSEESNIQQSRNTLRTKTIDYNKLVRYSVIALIVIVLGVITKIQVKKIQIERADQKIDDYISSIISDINAYDFESAVAKCNEAKNVLSEERLIIDNRDKKLEALTAYCLYFDGIRKLNPTLMNLADKKYAKEFTELRDNCYEKLKDYPELQKNIKEMDNIVNPDEVIEAVNAFYDNLVNVTYDEKAYYDVVYEKVYSINVEYEYFSIQELEDLQSKLSQMNKESKKLCDKTSDYYERIKELSGAEHLACEPQFVKQTDTNYRGQSNLGLLKVFGIEEEGYPTDSYVFANCFVDGSHLGTPFGWLYKEYQAIDKRLEEEKNNLGRMVENRDNYTKDARYRIDKEKEMELLGECYDDMKRSYEIRNGGLRIYNNGESVDSAIDRRCGYPGGQTIDIEKKHLIEWVIYSRIITSRKFNVNF